MADQYWVDKDATGLWSDADAWGSASGVEDSTGPPGAGDKAIFDGAVVTNCRVDIAVTVGELVTEAGYTGTIDATTDNPAIEVTDASGGTGDVILDGTRINRGSGQWTVRGNFDNAHTLMGDGTSSKLLLTGTAKTITSEITTAGVFKGTLEISGTYTTGGGRIYLIECACTVSGTLTISAGDIVLIYYISSLSITGTVTGQGTLEITYRAQITDISGTCDVAVLSVHRHEAVLADNWVLVAGTYESATVNLHSRVDATNYQLIFAPGTTTFTGNVNIYCSGTGTLLVDNSVNNPDLVFEGDLTVDDRAATVIWTKGTGTITLDGSNAQGVDLLDKVVENIVINKDAVVNTVTLKDGFTTDSLTLTQGTIAFDAGAMTFVIDDAGAEGDDTGSLTIGTNGQVDPTNLDQKVFNVDGDGVLTGSDSDLLNLVATGGWELNVAGTPTATWGDVAYSDASGGTEVDATANCTDSLNNTNWDFGVGYAGPTTYHLDPNATPSQTWKLTPA